MIKEPDSWKEARPKELDFSTALYIRSVSILIITDSLTPQSEMTHGETVGLLQDLSLRRGWHTIHVPVFSTALRPTLFLPLFLLALKRTDSSSDSTRRKDSTVSKVSDLESKAEVKAAAPESPRSSVPESPLFDVPGEDERLEEDMPWLKVVARVANGFNFYCTHQGFCHPCCFRRQMRASKRIMVAARRVSGRSQSVIRNFSSSLSDRH